MQKHSLNGKWKLYFFREQTKNIASPIKLYDQDIPVIEASVPGNVELDLSRAGYLPSDLYKGENILEVQKYEEYEWWYETKFSSPEKCGDKKILLHFEGVDCLAEYWLNNEKLGESKNMFIPVEFDISKRLKIDGENVLTVRIRSAVLEAYRNETPMHSLASGWDMNFDSVNFRKAPHSYGWDIMPRAVTSGIWRDVYLSVMDDYEVAQLFYYCTNVSCGNADIRFCYDLDMLPSDNMHLEIQGRCKESSFSAKEPMRFKAGYVNVKIDNPKLWWPYGYGEANLYETVVKFFKDGKLVAQKSINVGIRAVKLVRTDTTDGKNGSFCFHINGVPIMSKGSNWVPMDVFHSRDAERYEKALELVKDIGCNILRCWGGNVYEDAEFFDFCDKNGIMVWQDFAMACHAYPQTEEFLQAIREEATVIVKKYRNHPSIVLWSGDNECDEMIFQSGADPNNNRVTREVLPQVINSNDVGRPYLASSPYIAPEIYEQNRFDIIPEDHLWGPRDYFKSTYYTMSKAHFISEIGYHGCPSRKSLEKFIDKEFLWPITNNKQWTLHSSDHRNRDHRVRLMAKQIKQLFGSVPESLDDFTFASQVSQAEAKKFFIESIRVNRPRKSGIIWWNLLDGWPQMSDAVVDYYYEKKIAYDFIKRSQQPFAIVSSEIESWKVNIIASNDTLKKMCGTYSVKNIDTGEILLSGDFCAEENSNTLLGRIPIMYSDKGMLLMEWNIGGERHFNHYLYGAPAFDLAQYKYWYGQVK